MQQWPADARISVRMYRTGIGDCFLVRVPRQNLTPLSLLIDCGAALATEGAQQLLNACVEDILQTTGNKIDVLVATHEHWDHLSGFLYAADALQKLEVEQVWLAWTEDPDDELANKLRAEREAAFRALQLRVAKLTLLGATDAAEEVSAVLDFLGAAGRKTTRDALEAARASSTNVRYCRPTDAPRLLPDTNVRLYVLGPPTDERQLKRAQSKKDTFALALDTLRFELGSPDRMAVPDAPFGSPHAIPLRLSQQMPFFNAHYWTTDTWRRIDSAWLDSSSELALQLDSATNNTCLVLAIELDNGDVLLFPGDAQVGSWESWQDVSWSFDDNCVTRPALLRRTTGPELLRRTIFYKVGHHGSGNATLREAGLELMQRLQVAMIPVDEAAAKKRRWNHMPEPELVEALMEQTGGRVIRSDTAPEVDGNKLYVEVFL